MSEDERQETTRWRAAPGVLAEEIDGEVLVLDMESNQYFGLNELGALIWEGIVAEQTAAEIEATILQVYDVEPEAARRDLAAFCQELEARGLIEAGGS